MLDNSDNFAVGKKLEKPTKSWWVDHRWMIILQATNSHGDRN
jgi:hypothetical protein